MEAIGWKPGRVNYNGIIPQLRVVQEIVPRKKGQSRVSGEQEESRPFEDGASSMGHWFPCETGGISTGDVPQVPGNWPLGQKKAPVLLLPRGEEFFDINVYIWWGNPSFIPTGKTLFGERALENGRPLLARGRKSRGGKPF